MTAALTETDLPLGGKKRGKVRDIYDLPLADGTDAVLIIATDRISVFDVVLANGVPDKGRLLTKISAFWFDWLGDRYPHHLLSLDVGEVPGLSDAQRAELDGRIMICRKSRVIPVECIVRGYLTGSGYKEYLGTGSVCGINLPAGMTNSDRIESPIFTPSTKPEAGHDENISFEESCRIAGEDLMNEIREISLAVYGEGREYARERGIIIAGQDLWPNPIGNDAIATFRSAVDREPVLRFLRNVRRPAQPGQPGVAERRANRTGLEAVKLGGA